MNWVDFVAWGLGIMVASTLASPLFSAVEDMLAGKNGG